MLSYLQIFVFLFTAATLGAASLFDVKTREVPDSISYIFITGAILLLLLTAVYDNSLSALIYLPISVGLLFGFAYLMYIAGQWGGGDVKLMLGLSFIFTSVDLYSNTSAISLFINVLVFGGFYGLFATLIFGLMHLKHLTKYLKKYDLGVLGFGTVLTAAVILYLPLPLNYLMAFAVILLTLMRYIYIIAENLMYVETPVNRLTEGDWLAADVRDEEGKLLVNRRNIGLLSEDIKKLKGSGVKNVSIKLGLPFLPGILIGVLVTMLFGNVLLSVLVNSIP